MASLVCVPIMVEAIEAALADAELARDLGADLVELRIDPFFHGSEGDDATDAMVVEQLRGLIADCPLPVILTCRSAAEGGDYDGDEVDRVSLLEKLCVNTDHPPAYLDFELASYRASANIRQKINLCVDHPKQQRDVSTRLILSMHDFESRPSDLMRRLADAWAEPAASIVKFAYRARSIRDNFEIFEILREAPKPTIGLGMGEFGLMSRVLAPKFQGFLTFASLRESSATAPGQPTIAELLGMYRFRSIGKATKVYGVIGWPVAQSMSPLVHNAGFEARGWDGVYLPMPVADSDESLKATVLSLVHHEVLGFAGASVTIPHKPRLAALAADQGWKAGRDVSAANAGNTLAVRESPSVLSTDGEGVVQPLFDMLGSIEGRSTVLVGTGGVSASIAVELIERGAAVTAVSRAALRAEAFAERFGCRAAADVSAVHADVYINCTPVGMAGGPDPDGLSIPVHDLAGKLPPETVFFDTVYNPIETPMLKAAKEHAFRTIDGVQMFVRQAAAQFEMWTGEQAPVQLFDRLVRERLGGV